jgi:hypothetical protein
VTEKEFWLAEKLEEQRKRIGMTKLPLCLECAEFHATTISCEEVAEMMAIDARMLRNAIG